ncbi:MULTISPECIES: phosphate ABC transporter ATP-binding protein PstB [unclassified Pseudofrankia]|uniref:phosphate ABC transporter ATP-binding protein PstB n=1 Tax=unclassified Pseudofrankia TaxID=2994372 RepID=UPI0009F463C0|nr:phosphate ABC transporter ATP-binding protein PstB [Pseudofrankia sp. BMG5.36]
MADPSHELADQDRPAAAEAPPLAGRIPRATGRTVPDAPEEIVINVADVAIYYGSFCAVGGLTVQFGRREITALIGPSGCGKSTALRAFNRMNDLIPGARLTGSVSYRGQDLYGPRVDPITVRRRIGMVFQKPNPFPKSIYDNVAYGPRVTGMKVPNMDDVVEEALTSAALWDEVKDKLRQHAFGLSGGQQQRLCIARTIAVRPDVVLMDEPCSALDPISTAKIEYMMTELADEYTIIIVTHNMQQAARISDRTAFFTTEVDDATGRRSGLMVEFDRTAKIFSTPSDQRTEDYISGKFG